jgi:isopropylmalate/homocitrate/citramalate synthase
MPAPDTAATESTTLSVRPWEGPHWSTSPHNFDPAVAVPPRPVELHDITVRDGEECADVAYTVEDKVRFATALAGAGVQRMELFLTVPGWFESVRGVMERIAAGLPLELYVTWDAAKTPRVLDLGVRHVMVWYRCSDVYQQHVLCRPRAELLDEALDGIRAAKRAGAHVNLFMPESSRLSLDLLRDTIHAAEQAGADAFTFVDSLSICHPSAVRHVVGRLKTFTGKPIEVHCHNDYGLATACALAAYEGGADALHCSVNSIGYRAGGSSLEELAMGLEALYGVRTGVQLDRLMALSHLAAEISGIPIAYFKGVTGTGATRVEQWGATARLIAGGQRRAAFAFEPEAVGRMPEVLVGKWSDATAVEKKLADLGLTATGDQVQQILHRAHQAGLASKRPLADAELLSIALACGAQ